MVGPALVTRLVREPGGAAAFHIAQIPIAVLSPQYNSNSQDTP